MKKLFSNMALPSAYSVILLGITIAGLGFIGGCKEPRTQYCQGYYEADLIYVAAPVSGYVTHLTSKGTNVTTGQILYTLDNSPEDFLTQQATAQTQQAADLLADSQKGKRPDEIAALEAALAQAKAVSDMSLLEKKRLGALRKNNMVSENDYDRARYQHDANQQAVQQAEAQLAQAKLGARDDQIAANQAQLTARQQAQSNAQWQLTQKTQKAPCPGMVYDTYYRKGEWVPVGRPVASLLAPRYLKVTFFVPQGLASTLKIGQPVYIKNDYTHDWDTARISYISPDPEFTPPVIFSRDTDSKLIYLFEAHPDTPDITLMHPGQPVEVHFRKPVASK